MTKKSRTDLWTVLLYDEEGWLIGKLENDFLAAMFVVPKWDVNPHFDGMQALRRIWPVGFLKDKYNSRYKEIRKEYEKISYPTIIVARETFKTWTTAMREWPVERGEASWEKGREYFIAYARRISIESTLEA